MWFTLLDILSIHWKLKTETVDEAEYANYCFKVNQILQISAFVFLKFYRSPETNQATQYTVLVPGILCVVFRLVNLNKLKPGHKRENVRLLISFRRSRIRSLLTYFCYGCCCLAILKMKIFSNFLIGE
jgi:hypothetical protein